MSCGICARCKKRKGCRFRQPGTWVEECSLFVAASPASTAAGSDGFRSASGDGLSAVVPGGATRPHTAR